MKLGRAIIRLVLAPLIFAAAKLIAYKLFNSNKHNKTGVGGFGGTCNANGNDQASKNA